MELVLLAFAHAWNSWLFFPFWFLLFGMRMCILCLSDCCILEADNLFGFIGSQMKKNFAPRLQVSPTTDLCEIEDELWDFELTLGWDLGLRIDYGMIKIWGDDGMGWIYFAHGKHINIGIPEDRCYKLNCISLPKFIFWNPNLHCLRMSK